MLIPYLEKREEKIKVFVSNVIRTEINCRIQVSRNWELTCYRYLARWGPVLHVEGSRTRPGILVVSRYLFFYSSVFAVVAFHLTFATFAPLRLLFNVQSTSFRHCFSSLLCAVANSSSSSWLSWIPPCPLPVWQCGSERPAKKKRKSWFSLFQCFSCIFVYLEGTPEEVLQRLFRTFDVNGDGKISKKEMQVNFFVQDPGIVVLLTWPQL